MITDVGRKFRDSIPKRYCPADLRMRLFCRCQSRSFTAARLSCFFLPLARPTVSLAFPRDQCRRSEEHTSEPQSLRRISYAVFCLKKKKKQSRQLTTDAVTQNKQKKNNLPN